MSYQPHRIYVLTRGLEWGHIRAVSVADPRLWLTGSPAPELARSGRQWQESLQFPRISVAFDAIDDVHPNSQMIETRGGNRRFPSTERPLSS